MVSVDEQDSGIRAAPRRVPGEDHVGIEDLCRRDDQDIGQAERSKPRPKLSSVLSDRASQGLYLKLKFSHAGASIDQPAAAGWAHETFSVGGRRKPEIVPGVSQHRRGRSLVKAIRSIEEPDHDARIQNCQRHSERSFFK